MISSYAARAYLIIMIVMSNDDDDESVDLRKWIDRHQIRVVA